MIAKFNKQVTEEYKEFCLFQCSVIARYCSRFNLTQFDFANNQAKHFCNKHSL